MRNMSGWAAAVLVLAGSALAARAEEPAPEERPGAEEAGAPPQEVERFLGELRRDEPGVADELERARREHPDAFARQTRGFAPMLRDADGRGVLKRNIRADFEARRAVHAYKEARDPAERKKLEPEMRKALEAQFDAKMAAHEMHLKKMTAELAKLKERIEKRRAQRAQLIDKRLRELTNEDEDWDW